MNPLLNLLNGTRDFSLVQDGPLVQALVPVLLEDAVLGDGALGVELLGLDVDNASFQVLGDTVVVDGIGEIISDLETDDFDTRDGEAQFAVFDLSDEDEFALNANLMLDADNIETFLAREIAGGLPRVEITGIDQDNITIHIGGDTLIIDQAQDQIAAVTSDFIEVGDGNGELAVLDASGEDDDFLFVGDSGDVGDEFAALASGGEAGGLPVPDRFIVGEDEALAMAEELLLGDGVDGVEVLNVDDDTLTIEVAGEDIIVFDNIDLGVLTGDVPMV